MKKSSRVFYGWWVVAATFGITFCTATSPFAVILKNLMTEFNCGRGPISFLPSIFFFSAGVTGLFVGRVITHHSPKKFMLWGTVIAIVSLLLCSLTNSLWQMYVLYVLLGVGLNGISGPIPIVTLLSRWFTRKRGLAFGICWSGFALGNLVITPIFGLLTENFGWRSTFLFGGLLMLAISIPLNLFMIRDRPEEKGLLPDGEKYIKATSPIPPVQGATGQKIEISTYLKSLPLWLICIGFPLIVIGESAITQHEVSFITDMGIPATLAASAFGITGGLSIVGRLSSGYLADRVSARYVEMMFISLAVIGVFILMRANSMPIVWLFVIVYGLVTGASGTLLPLVIVDIFGPASMSVIFGLVNFVFTSGLALGAPLAGFIFDATGSYTTVFTVVAILYLVAMASIYFAYGVSPKIRRTVR